MTHERIHANTLNTLLLLFRPLGFRTRIYSVTNIADSIIYACTSATSITETCGSLAHMPSREGVQYHLAKIDTSRVNAAVNRVLQQQERVMEVLGSKVADMAFDITKVPYHGQPEKEGDVRRGAAESGTTHFFMYASAYVMLYGRRFTLALKHVRADESMADVIRYLLHEVQKRAGVRIKCLFLDKGFFTTAVISYLNSTHIPYIIAAFPRGRKGGRLSRLTRKRRDSFVVPDCEMTDSATGEKCTFRLYAVSKYRKKRYRKKKKHGVQYMYYAAGNGVNIPVERMFDLYRRRFGIESSYRTMKKSRGRTSSRSAVLRLLHILVSFVIQNEWVYIKWQYLSKVTRGRYGKKYDSRFTYFRMRQFLRLALEMAYGAVNAILIENSRSVVGDGG